MTDKPFEVCKECGTPQLEGKLAVVLYFKNEGQREEFVKAAKEALPGATSYNVDPPGYDNDFEVRGN